VGGNLDFPKAMIDSVHDKLLVMNPYGVANYRPSLLRCELDGTGCTFTDISAGLDTYSEAPVIDPINDKLLVVGSVTPGVIQCNLDGTSCLVHGIADGYHGYPTALIDTAHQKLLVVTAFYTPANNLNLYRCNLDGTGCVHEDISAGVVQSPGSNGWIPKALLDPVNGKLLVVATAETLGLFRCELDGTGCSFTDISGGAGAFEIPSAVIDTMNRKLLVVAAPVNGNLQLIRCELDGTSCTHMDINAGGTSPSPFSSATLVDGISGNLLIVTAVPATSTAPTMVPVLFRCHLDGTACAYSDLSAGLGGYAEGNGPASSVLDSVRGRVLVVDRDAADSRLTLFSTCVR
jgi:DNA-binding beta-propeller fold protein YncE